ncbi:c-type cytochrome [Minwuia sp.]|uniref:c-type cytochrome n=1 Tax=Minwuia sp. TaxID=2493630 RepID=UPI003A93497E
MMFKITGLALAALVMSATLGQTPVRAADADTGNQLYHTYCSVCHGPRMINSGARAADLRKMKPGDKARFIKVVKEGKRGPRGEMPAWSDIVTDEEIDHMWAYVKTKGK